MKRQWSGMDNLMQRAVRRHNFGTQLTATAICEMANRIAKGRWQAISFRDGCLKIVVADYDTAAYIRIEETHILQEINTALGSDAVTKLRFEVRPLPTNDLTT